jgi:predicted RNase H-like nuclease
MGVGVDGCRDGWFCVFREGGRIEELVVASITDLFVLFPERMVAEAASAWHLMRHRLEQPNRIKTRLPSTIE